MHVKYYYQFNDAINKRVVGNKLDKTNWDILREQTKDKRFGFEKTKEQYIRNAQKEKKYYESALLISKILRVKKCQKVISLGVGKGILEYWIKELQPNIHVTCTDYAEGGIKTLKKYSNCDEFYTFDMLNGNYRQFDTGDCLIMYRVSTEFSLKQWKNIFNRIYQSNVSTVIFVPTELANITDMVKGIKGHVRNLVLGNKDIMSGWLYSQSEIEFFLTNAYKNRNSIEWGIPVDNTKIYVIRIK